MIPKFNRDHSEGQMHDDEREALYNHVVATRPEKVFEIATWRGGGSTYFIASGLHTNGKGHLWTVEWERANYEHAVELYKDGDLKDLKGFVSFNLGSSTAVFPGLLRQYGPIDMAFVDGGFSHTDDDSIQQICEFEMLEPHVRVGGHVLYHDWQLGKTRISGPYMLGRKDFKLEWVVHTLACFSRTQASAGKAVDPAGLPEIPWSDSPQ